MKKILILFAVVNLLLIGVIAGLLLLSETCPFRPGDSLYGLQGAAERWRLNMTPGAERQAELALGLVERRLADLAGAQDGETVEIAARALDDALVQAIVQLSRAPVASQDPLLEELEAIIGRAEMVVSSLRPAGYAAVEAVDRRLAELREVTTREALAIIAEREIAAAVAIPFLGEVDHGDFSLEGGHTGAECLDCHLGGEYADTPAACSSCHRVEPAFGFPDYIPVITNPLYPDHYEGECSECHHVDDWTPIAFDHQDIPECQSCHQADGPADHYPGECIACHQDGTDWSEAAFDHTEVEECLSCHQGEAPPMQYAGILANCYGPSQSLGTGLGDVLIADRLV